MAAKTAKTCLKDVMVLLRLLANTEQKKCSESLETKRKSTFDELLKQNVVLVREALSNDASLQELREVVDMERDFAADCVCKSSDLTTQSEKNNCVGDGLSNLDEPQQGHVTSLNNSTKKVGMFSAGDTTVNRLNVRWTFCQDCLRMLSCLRETLQGSKCHENGGKAAPTDLLSISDQKIVAIVIQLVVVLGICPNLLPGVGIPIEQRSGFSHILKSNSEDASPRCPKCLYEFTMTLVKLLGEPTLSMLILSRHLSDVLLSLLQLAHAPEMCFDKSKEETSGKIPKEVESMEGAEFSSRKSLQTSAKFESHGVCDRCHKMVGCEGGVLISATEHEECAKALGNIVDKMYQPLVVRELLFLQGSMVGGKSAKKKVGLQKSTDVNLKERSTSRTPQWLKEVCGRLLSKCLMRKNGVQNVLRGILEGASGTSVEWKVCEAIAQLIANCPFQVQSADDYYKSISPQVLDLLHLQNPKLRQQYGRVSVQIIHAMITRYPHLAAKYIVDPLMRPFLLATKDSAKKCTVLADEMELTQCIEGLHKVFVASPDSNHLAMRNFARIVVPVFALFCFTRHGVSHVRTALQELISTFFKRSNERNALIMLYVLAFNELPSTDSKNDFLKTEDVSSTKSSSDETAPRVALMESHCAFGYGEGGGVMLIRTDPSKGERSGGSNTEEFLGKRKDVSETRALCLVEILENLRKDDVPGHFFLYLLQQVQEMILDPDFGEMERAKALTIFHVLALICEKLGPSVLKNTRHMISFIHVTLTRAHHVYVEMSREGGSGGGEFELETLTMALGMLSALLSGAVKVEPSDHSKLQELAPLLRRIADEHIEDEIRELANDLLVVILTQGAVWSEKTKQSGERSKQPNSSEAPSTNNQGQNSSIDVPQGYASAEQLSADFDEAFEQLCDPLLPARGHALMRLAVLLRNRDCKAFEKVDVLVKTFQDSLIHDDSYIYLAAIEGLVSAADVRTADVIPYLAREFVTCHENEVECTRREQQMKKGMYVAAKEEFLSKKQGCPVTTRSVTTRMKLGEALLRATKRCGELVPLYFKTLVQAFLTGVKDRESFIRASSLSNLGEVCRLSPHTLSSAVHEIFHCVSTVLKSDNADEVRQAAVLVITLVLRGLGSNSVKVLSEILKDLYQLLKLVESGDKDETTRVHAQVALGELESIMTEQLFPRQQLVKHIHVLP